MPTALLSAFNKDGVTEFARALKEIGNWNILASGGTTKHLMAGGVAARDVAELIGEAVFGHRVVTLSREVYMGILARSIDEDREVLRQRGIPEISLVYVDLYPLEATIETLGITHAEVIEKIDIGGPTMLRAAAKNRIVIADRTDMNLVIEWLANGLPNKNRFMNTLAAKAERIIEHYCGISAKYREEHLDADVGYDLPV